MRLGRKKFGSKINNNRVGEKDCLIIEKDHLTVERWEKMVGP